MAAMAKKTCFKCKEPKPLREFYKHPFMGDGHLGKCKTCTKKDSVRRYYEKASIVEAYDKRRNKDPDRRRRCAEARKKRDAANPGAVRARRLVASAIRRGDLVRQPCEKCGEKKRRVFAHHDDYRKPLSVRWLCGKHHRREHLKDPTPLPEGV